MPAKESNSVPFYWKRGLFAGLAIAAIMSFLVHRLVPTLSGAAADAASSPHHTPFGPLMGMIIFALFCVLPGPNPDERLPGAKGAR